MRGYTVQLLTNEDGYFYPVIRHNGVWVNEFGCMWPTRFGALRACVQWIKDGAVPTRNHLTHIINPYQDFYDKWQVFVNTVYEALRLPDIVGWMATVLSKLRR